MVPASSKVRFPLRHRGFTLVELLVVMAILGVMTSLLLPAVQAAREAARRSQCQNNLKQIGIATNNYLTIQRKFPLGCIGCNDGKQQMISWNVQLLPFLEQQPLADQYQLETPSYSSPNRELGAALLPVFLCPSTVEDLVISDTSLWRGQAFTDYGGNYGVEGGDHDAPEEATQTLVDEWLGVFLYNEAVTASQITDGLSQTAAVIERRQRRISSTEWPCGWNIFAHEVDTPVNYASALGDNIGSPHPGGALILFCDGHVEFVTETTSQERLHAMLTKAGGIW